MNKEIRLTEYELKQMLRGTLLWSDIAPRLNPPPGARSGIRKLGTPISSRQSNSSNSNSDNFNSVNSNSDNSNSDNSNSDNSNSDNSNPVNSKSTDHYMQSPNSKGDNDLKEVRALLYERGEGYQRAFEGTKVVVLLSFAGIVVVSLWLYYFLNA